ncbi:MAG: ABC-2 transporter permease [Gammaproteobacteria bacterium]|nr:ABC-2 transporter permease [Gammaproteobacteria bacterium]NNJ73128.1 hypothetical protein [Enterobacterales bacterium]
MNYAIIKQLVNKDWQLNKGPLTLYVVMGFASLWVFTIPTEFAFTLGIILLVSILAIIGIHMVVTTVLHERKDQTLTFVMSLPVSFKEYTLAKILSISIVSGGAWLLIFSTVLGFSIMLDSIGNGLIPYMVMTLVHMLVIYAVLMATAIVSENEIATIIVMTLLNVSISIFMMGIANLEDVGPFISGQVAVWNDTSIGIVLLQLFTIVLSVYMTFYFQSKKRSYL